MPELKNNIQYVDINNARGEKMIQKWQGIIADGVDPFDPQYVENYLEGTVILESDHWYAFQNDHPYDNIQLQLVIVTKKFFKDSYDLPDDVWLDLKAIKNKLRDQFEITGGGFVMRFGDTTLSGGTVVHLHAQIIVPAKEKKVAAWFGSGEK
ncbi:MAG TPA: hypothetical protein VLB02_02790 [Candidatus Paceibacterota bacterium]|nr:hypothetical protein [Candidatus Paceibacterota bacterium]